MERQGAEQALLEAVAFLVTAWKNLFAYPLGHPARAASLAIAHTRLAAFMAGSGRLVLGVARDGLLYGSKKIESVNVGAFAEALYRRNAALVYIEEDVSPGDLEQLLRLLAESPGGPERAPIGEELRAAGVDRVTITSIDYTRLITTDRLTVAEPRPAGSLWDTLIGALLTGKHLTPDGTAPLRGETYSAAGLAELLNRSAALGGAGGAGGVGGPGGPGGGGTPEGEGGSAAMRALASAMADHLTRVRGREKDVALHQVAELLRALPGEVREPLLASALRTLEAEEQSPERLQSLVASLEPDQVLQSLRRLNTEGARLSPHALRMIQTLAAAREELTTPDRTASVSADIAEVSALFEDEDVDRFNPEDHRTLLAQVAAVDLMTASVRIAADPAIVGTEMDTLTDDAIDASLVTTLFDLGAAYPETAPAFVVGRLRILFMRSLDETRFDRALGIVRGVRALAEDEDLTPEQRAGRAHLVGSLVDALSLSSLLASAGTPDNLTLSQIQSLIGELGPASARGVLAALTAETDRTRRFQLFDLAASLGLAIVPEAKRLLSDSRWFVVRNMIVLLRRVGDRTSLGEVQRCAEDPDPRVGLEAIIKLLAFESDVSRELLARAIHHPDPKFAEAAIALTGQHGIVQAIDPLVEILRRWDPFGAKRSLRLKALRALKALKAVPEVADPEVLARLERYFRHWRVPFVNVEERRAAYRLLEVYPEDIRAPYVERGRKSRDQVIRAICDRLAKSAARRAVPEEER
jgi:hypothetical protein